MSTQYGVSAEEAQRFGLPCGGTLELVLEPLSALSRIDELLAQISRHELVKRLLDMDTGQVSLSKAHPNDQLSFEANQFIHVFGPRWRLLIIGAGQLSKYLAQIGQALDYSIIVCDPREEYADVWDVPGVDFRTQMPDDVAIDLRLDAHSAVVTLTHDPKLDDLALMEALKSPAFYVGAIGSRKNNESRRQRLLQFDLSVEQVDRLHGPVGLKIGSKTPPEIAISILAEMTAIKNGTDIPLTIEKPKATLPGCVV
jgi:xanthine dehydrogenase accessory factor